MNVIKIIFFFSCFSVLVTARADLHATDAQAAIPNVYEEQYQTLLDSLTEDEREWFHRFQQGNFLVTGWRDISARILAEFPEDKQKEYQGILGLLGYKIGTEWARDNDVRKIDTSMLRTWGDRLTEAAEENNLEHLSMTIYQIDQEVDALLKQ